MKRMQAIVSGKNKQCTKLPAPTPLKGKKEDGSSPGKKPEKPPRDKDTKKQTGKNATTAPPTAPTTTTSPPPTPTSPTSPTTTNTTKTTSSASAKGVTNKTVSSRAPSKIPATSPKKVKEPGANEMKEKASKDSSEGKGKSKSFLIRKLSSSSKDKQRKVDVRSRSASDTNRSSGGSSGGYASSGGETGESKSKQTLPVKPEIDVESQGSVSNVSSSTLTPQPSLQGIGSDPSPHRRGSDGTLRADDNKSVQSDPNSEPAKNGKASIGPTPSSSQNGSVRRHVSLSGHQDRQYGVGPGSNRAPKTVNANGSGAPTPTTSMGSIPKNGPASNNYGPHTMPRDRGVQGMAHVSRQPSQNSVTPYHDPNPYQNNGYRSLPRSRSRSTTPTPESYSFGSLPRRSNSNTPTPQTTGYINNNYASWGSLSRGSEPGNHQLSHLDRARLGLTSSNSINYDPYSYAQHHKQQPPRSGSVPPHGVANGPDSIYSLARPFSTTPEDQLDHHRRYPPGQSRAGSVPLGYESESSAYSSGDGLRNAGVRNYESDSGYEVSLPGSNFRVQPGDEMYRAGPGKRPIPRRHTLGGKKESETERKRDAFMKLLAQRYPQYADRIQGGTPVPGQTSGGPSSSQAQGVLDKPARSRDPQRRRPGPAVIYDPRQATNTFEYDDLGTMSDLELPSFQRGGFMRTSLPIVRSASTSLERPLGLVFLVHGSQTKKSLLPNEVTTLDTVRALFVRAFTDLTMEMMETSRRKIYLLDPTTNIYFQLEDLGEIKDRSVLKLHETDDDIPQKVRERQEVRGRTVQVPLSRSQSRAVENPEYSKSHTLPHPAAVSYPDGTTPDQWNARDLERSSRSRTPEPMERPRSLSAGASSRQRYSHSPERFTPADRNAGGGSLNPIPENRQVNPGYREPNYYETIGPHSPNNNYSRGGYPQSHYDSQNPYAIYAAPPQQQAYIARSTRTSTTVHPQRAMGPTPADIREGTRGANPSSRHPPAFAQGPMTQAYEPIYQRSQSYQRPPVVEKDVEFTRSISATPDNHYTKNRIEKMEQQLANLTAWVHYQKSDLPGQRKESSNRPRSLGSTTSDSSDTFPASSASKHSEEISPPLSTLAPTNHVVPATQGLSDNPDGQRPSGETSGTASTISIQSARVPAEISGQLSQLKSDLHVLRRQTQLNVEAMKEEFMKAFSSIKAVISSVPGAENQINFHKRVEATKTKTGYLSDKVQVDQELGDLESSVEELRNDVINHQCRVQLTDVEGMALLLSNITKNLADLKAQFPDVHGKMKVVMNNEMQLVVAEENFLKEEPAKIEKSLMRCKKLTGTLYTLKRLASVQDHRPPHIPNLAPTQGGPEEDPKKTLLENIRALVPDHDRRVQEMKATEAARQRKKKISTQQEALKFGKTLEMVSKNLRPCSSNNDKGDEAEEREVKEQFKSENNGIQEAPVIISSQNSLSSKPSSSSSSQNMYSYASSLPSSTPSIYSSTMSSSSSSSSGSSSSSLLSAVALTSTTYTVSSSSTSAEIPPVSVGPSIKPLSSFSASLTTTSKPSDKPTATVSAMTSTSTEIPRSVISSLPHKPPRTEPLPLPTSTKSATLPLTEMTERLTSNVQTGTGPVAHTVSTSTEMPKKSDASVSAFTFTSEASSSTYKPPVFTKPQRLTSPIKSPRAAPIVESESCDISIKERPKSSGIIPSTSKTPPISKANSLDFSPSKYYRPLLSSSSEANGHVNGVTDNKGEEEKSKPYRKAARSVFSSAWVSPPLSPTSTSPKTTPLNTPAGTSISQITPGGTINLVLTGVASPKSPTNPGTFTITAPTDITTDTVANSSQPTSESKSPASTPAITPKPETETSNKQKKVPPPPPPRKGSRPTSMTNLPSINGDEQEKEVPQFVGGILGQHRLSGGPLSSTPKPASQQRALSTFEKDIASGIYANLNRPDLQNQSSSPQQMLDKANTKRHSDPINTSETQAPLVSTTCVDRTERGSSSESTSSSNSGTSSMGSQQSVVNVARSASVNMRSSHKSKPEPPKRHSSLMSKAPAPVPAPDTRVHSRRKTLNGVDL